MPFLVAVYNRSGDLNLKTKHLLIRNQLYNQKVLNKVNLQRNFVVKFFEEILQGNKITNAVCSGKAFRSKNTYSL
jgi:hypothetical protein